MEQPNRENLKNFNMNSLPSLDTVVLGALEMLTTETVPTLDVTNFKRPLVVGSGNAEATGRILFAETDAIFASESSVDDKLSHIDDIDEVVIVSASGGKHAPILARKARDAGKHVTLITNTPNSPAQRELSDSEITALVYPKNREPYTYNTSTYMSMMMGLTHEDPAAIKRFIEEQIDTLELPDLSQFDKYYLIVPPKFADVIRMLHVKFIELFGRNIARDVETSEYVRHATTVAPSNNELFISFGEPNTTWGNTNNRLNVPLPKDANYIAMVAVGYYVIAQIQKAHPQYFKENINAYCQFISGVFGESIMPIVDGTV